MMLKIDKTTQLSIRIPVSVKERIVSVAKSQGIPSACLIRKILESWAIQEEKQRAMSIENIVLDAVSESLYMLRGIADQINPALKDGAKQYRQSIKEKLKKD